MSVPLLTTGKPLPWRHRWAATASKGVTAKSLIFLLFGLFALNNVLVAAFVGKVGLTLVLAGIACLFLTSLCFSERRLASTTYVAWPTILICLLIAFVLLLLGGEGGFFYANEDWQVRDAVLADMTRAPWPFAYWTSTGDQVLRAPIGMYLAPALIGKSALMRASIALLLCNTLAFGMMLSVGATLFPTGRWRRNAAMIFVAFSGLDSVGTLIVYALTGQVSFDHLERWAPGLQYSSVITLIFWVPHHAMAGWFCAMLFLLHRKNQISIGALAASVPLIAIWSPLAAAGSAALAAWAGLRTLWSKDWVWIDVVTAGTAVMLVLPALAYLGADTNSIPSGVRSPPSLPLLLCLMLEVLPFTLIVLRLGGSPRFGNDSLILVTILLFIMPFYHIGMSIDFMMRASIAPLAVLAALLIDSMIGSDAEAQYRIPAFVMIVLALGALTGIAEIARTIRILPSPTPRCTLPGVWYRQTEYVADISTYVAHRRALPAFLVPDAVSVLDPRDDPVNCWDHPWKMSR